MTLYEMSEKYRQLFGMLEMGEETGDADMVQCALDTLESFEMDLNEKMENTACYIKGLHGEVDMIATEQKRLAERKQTLNNRIARIKESVKKTLEAANTKKAGGVRGEFRLQLNPEHVAFTDEAYFRTWCEKYDRYLVFSPPEINLKEVKEDLKGGALLVGVELRRDMGVRMV